MAKGALGRLAGASKPPNIFGDNPLKAHRQAAKAAGERGKALREDQQQFARGQLQHLVGDTANYVQHPERFLKGVIGGKGPAFKRLAYLQGARAILGTEKPAAAYEQHELNQLQQADTNPEGVVDERRGAAPTESALSTYAQSHLGQGLTPEETAAVRGAGQEAIGSGATDAYRQEGEREAAAGIDPRSGIAAQRAMQIERGTQQERAGLERDITNENLARKGQLESLASGQAGLEEGARESDVNANLRRLADIENQGAGQERFREGQSEYETNYTEGQRQAKLQRDAWARAARASQPSGVEKAGAIIGGLTGGGGGI